MWSPSCPVVIRSIPGAPALRLTARQAIVALSLVTTSSIRSSYVAFCVESRGTSDLASLFASLEATTSPRWCFISRVVAVIATPCCFGRLFGSWFQLLIELRSFVLRSFALPRFWPGFFATMTSADCLLSLKRRLSLGQQAVFPLMPPSSTTSRLLVLGFACARLLARDWLPRYSFVFLRPRICFRFFRAPLAGHALTLSFGWPNAPVGNFHPARLLTCQAHERGHSCPQQRALRRARHESATLAFGSCCHESFRGCCGQECPRSGKHVRSARSERVYR